MSHNYTRYVNNWKNTENIWRVWNLKCIQIFDKKPVGGSLKQILSPIFSSPEHCMSVMHVTLEVLQVV